MDAVVIVIDLVLVASVLFTCVCLARPRPAYAPGTTDPVSEEVQVRVGRVALREATEVEAGWEALLQPDSAPNPLLVPYRELGELIERLSAARVRPPGPLLSAQATGHSLLVITQPLDRWR